MTRCVNEEGVMKREERRREIGCVKKGEERSEWRKERERRRERRREGRREGGREGEKKTEIKANSTKERGRVPGDLWQETLLH